MAALTKPAYCPPEGQSKDGPLPQTMSSLGARGVTNVANSLLSSMYPVGLPWAIFEPPPEVLYNLGENSDDINRLRRGYAAMELMLMSLLESPTAISPKRSKDGKRAPVNRSTVDFRANMLSKFTIMVITGDSLARLTDDYRYQVYRRDQYVTERDSCGDVIRHIVREKIDPVSLGQEACQAAGLDWNRLLDKPAAMRMEDLYTRVRWEPDTRIWTICQELKGKEINESEDEWSPFFSTPYELVPGEHYGRGFAEQNQGDLRSHNELRWRMLTWADLASRQHPVFDLASEAQAEDLSRPSGTPLHGFRVSGGVVQDVAWLGPNKVADFGVVATVDEAIRADLGRNMQLDSENVRKSERTTAFEIQEITIREAENMTGGAAISISGREHLPLLMRLIYQARRDGFIAADFKDEMLNVRPITGLAALANRRKLQGVTSALGLLAEFGGDAILQEMDLGTLATVVMKYSNVYEPGLILTPEQKAARQQAAMQQAAAVSAMQQAIETSGAVAEQAAAGAIGQ